MNDFAPSIVQLVAVEHRAGAGGAGVRARLRLGQPEAGQRAAGDEVGQPLLLLLVGAVGQDRVDAEADTGLQRDADRLVDPAELLDRDAQRGEVRPRAAVLLRRGQPEQAEFAHGVHDVDREMVLAVPLRHVRRDLALGEVAHDLAERLVVLGQLERHDLASPDALTFTSTSSDHNAVAATAEERTLDGRRAGRRARHHHPHAALLRGRGPARRRSARAATASTAPRDHARMRLILRGRRFGMTLAECREIVDMYDGARVVGAAPAAHVARPAGRDRRRPAPRGRPTCAARSTEVRRRRGAVPRAPGRTAADAAEHSYAAASSTGRRAARRRARPAVVGAPDQNATPSPSTARTAATAFGEAYPKPGRDRHTAEPRTDRVGDVERGVDGRGREVGRAAAERDDARLQRGQHRQARRREGEDRDRRGDLVVRRSAGTAGATTTSALSAP